MATSGQLGGKLSESDLVGLLERVSAQTQKTTTVKVSKLKDTMVILVFFYLQFDRRRAALDSDSD